MDADPTLTNLDQPTLHAGSPFVIGQVLEGKYEILSLLGRGGMGAVYRVRHMLLNVELALKTLDTQRIGDSVSARRFQTEAKAAFSLTHPNLVKVHDSGVFEDGQPFLVMDLVQGKTLQTLIKERGRLPLNEIASIFAQLCFGLAHAHHQQVVHRDIKPANIMLVDGLSLKEEGSVKILDFGIAKIVNADRGEIQTLTQTGEVFGSPLYMSPEQCSGEAIDQRSDVYSLGCVLFEALTGTPPLVGNNALRTMMLHVNDSAPSLKEATLGSQFPEELEKIVEKMLAKSPGDRYSDLSIAAHAIFAACTGEDLSTLLNHPSKNETATVASRKGPTKITLNYAQLAALILVTALVTSTCTFYIERFAGSGKTITKVDEQDAVIVDSIGASPIRPEKTLEKLHSLAKESFDKISEITPVPDKPGLQKIVFPETQIGVVAFADGAEFQHQAAKGAVYTPLGAKVWLDFESDRCPFVLCNPTIFKKIDTNLVVGLAFTGPEREIEKDALPETRYYSKQAESGIEPAFVTFGKWKNIGQLKLRNIALTPSIIAEIDKMKNLKLIHFNDVDFPTHLLEKRELFGRIETLIVENCSEAEILKEAAKSSSIRHIEILSKASVDDIQRFIQSKNLRKLVFKGDEPPEVILAAATQLKQLGELQFKALTLSKSQMLEVQKNWKCVSYSGDGKNFVSLRR